MNKREQLERAVVDALAAYEDAADFYASTLEDVRAAVYTSTTDYDVAYAIAYDAHCAADTAYITWSRARKELKEYPKGQDNA
tara:strand:- start:41 stop:286 length:246 start_codon:yes stop_codon:yes gene_type:complete